MFRVIFLLAALLQMTAAAHCQELPGTRQDKDFDEFVKTLDLEDPSLLFIYKGGKNEGSSIGFHMAAPGHRKHATFMPYNNSNNLEAEVVSYRLARALGISDLYNPVNYYPLGPKATARFEMLLRQNRESDPDRKINYDRIMGMLKKNPKSILGTYRLRPKGRFFRVQTYGFGLKMNTGTQMAGFISAGGPMPSDRLMSIPGVSGERPEYPKPFEKESEIARQLSIIMVVDQLTGQWDRFFNNLEAIGDQYGRLRLFSRDNGGAEVAEGEEWFAAYQNWVSRYDREEMEKLKALLAFLQGKAKSFGGFDSVDKWKAALGFQGVAGFNMFKTKLGLLLDKRLPQLEKQFGEKVYFVGNRPDPATLTPSPVAIVRTAGPDTKPFGTTETTQCQQACDVARKYSYAEPALKGEPKKTPTSCVQWVVIRLVEAHPKIGAFPISDTTAPRLQEAKAERNIESICAADKVADADKRLRECRAGCAQP